MKVAILGSGNGALAEAFEWSRAGHDVYMFDFPQFDKQVSAITKAGGIFSEGQMEGFQPVKYAGHDIAYVLKDADLVFAVGPAYATEPFGKACAPYAEKGQIFVVCPSSCMGAILFKNALGLSVEDHSVIVADTSTLPYAVRIIADGKIAVYNRLGGGVLLATLPSSKNDMVYDLLKPVHECVEKAKNIFQTCLQNANPMLHPCITTLNAARIEGPDDFFFYEEGVTPGVGRLLKAIDDERIQLGAALGLEIENDPHISIRQGYLTEESYDHGYSKAPGFMGIKAQTQLDYRYYNEDAGFGLVLWVDLADRLGLALPNVRAMLQIVSSIMGRDYKAEKARTLDTLGLSGYSMDELLKIL
ncbi:MAG: NAD/NADP octopine/nopaline dehydrogenase family protein [Clostridia bacterium]|nr:NAD/NADP octopine/nopaline dehydrogenase family protein [Clostridia bacterium]MBR5044309.1 NAD/NADP octopine/nopaline dehydrogenase family protein [Clostridia bacterium]